MRLSLLLILFFAIRASAQLPLSEPEFVARLQPGGPLPEDLLRARTVVFYPYQMPMKELETFQKAFQRTGIDAVLYYETDLLTAGRDAILSVAGYLNSREIANLILLRKDPTNGYAIYIAPYNKKGNFVEDNQSCWSYESKALDVLLQHVYRTVANAMRKENYLVNDVPETSSGPNVIYGNRNEFFAIDLRVDELAVPKFGIEEWDRELEEIMKDYPYKYKLTEPGISESDLRKQGFHFVLRFARARNKVVRQLLDYDVSRAQNAFVSVTYNNDAFHLKNYPIHEVVYKFYFKHIESANVFLGTKWDADPSWQQALVNQLKGLRQEFKGN